LGSAGTVSNSPGYLCTGLFAFGTGFFLLVYWPIALLIAFAYWLCSLSNITVAFAPIVFSFQFQQSGGNVFSFCLQIYNGCFSASVILLFNKALSNNGVQPFPPFSKVV